MNLVKDERAADAEYSFINIYYFHRPYGLYVTVARKEAINDRIGCFTFMMSWHQLRKLLRRSILTELMLIITIVIVPLAFLFGWYAVKSFINVIENDHLTALKVLSEEKTNTIDSYMKGHILHVESFSQMPTVQQAMISMSALYYSDGDSSAVFQQQSAQYDGFFKRYRTQWNYYDIFLIDLQGNVIYSSKHENNLSSNVMIGADNETGLAQAVKKTLRRSESSISSFEFFAPSQEGAGFVSAPILHEGRIVGALAFQFGASEFYKVVNDYTGLGRSGEIVIGQKVEDHVLLIAPLRHDPKAAFNRKIKLDSAIALPIREASYGMSGMGTTIDWRGVEALAVWKYVPSIKLAMVVKIDAEEAFESWSDIKTNLILCFIISLFFIYLLLYLFAKQITEPLHKLTEASSDLDMFGEVLNLDSLTVMENEVGTLARGFSTMAEHIQESEESLKAALISAEQAGIAKSQFLATMSHEIRTPLNGVLGLTELVLASELTGEQREQLGTVKLSGETLLIILNDILDFSKIEAGLMEVKLVEFNPNEVIENVAKLFASKVNQDEAVLELIARGIPHLPHFLVGDSDRLHQVLSNLLSNAVKFTSRGEIIIGADIISESDADALVRFHVTDTGNGISEADQIKIFEQFMQADGTDTRKHGGTGLGLSISKTLVELMGGEIGVESELGKGSSFFFEIRLKKSGEVKDGPHHYRPQLSQWQILVVDDNTFNRNKIHGALNAWGMHCKALSSGPEALQELREKAGTHAGYHIITIDQQMEGMDGMVLARHIKNTPALAELKVIMTTSLDMTFNAQLRDEYGLDGFIRKPVYLSSLFETILSVMGERKQYRALDVGHEAPERKEKILLAEDNVVNQQVAMGLLANQGFKGVDLAQNGIEAMDLFTQTAYDLILMDVQMPELDGISAARGIRKLEDMRSTDEHVTIIAVTAHALAEDRQRTKDAGMDGHLTKPLTGTALQEMLAEWLPMDEENEYINTSTQVVVEEEALVQNDSVIDESILRQMRTDIGCGIGMIIDAYVAELPRDVEALESAIANADADALRSCAHRLKGASNSVAALGFGEMCFRFESMAKDGELEAAVNQLPELKAMADAVQLAFSASWVDEVR